MHEKSKPFTPVNYLELLLQQAAQNGIKRGENYPGRRFFGYFCSYWPEEIILAAGLEPLRILPTGTRGTPAELPAYCCSLARVSLAAAVSGEYHDLAGVGFAHTCDTMQCLGGVWDHTLQNSTTLSMVPPVILNAPGAHRYYEEELKTLLAQINNLADSRVNDAALTRATNLCRRIRRLAAELDQMRGELPSPLVSALLRAGQVMPRTDYAAALEAALPAVREKASPGTGRLRIMVSGAVLENDSLFQMIEELGGRVVADDTCTGFRHYVTSNETDNLPPLKALVQRYSDLPPCPCRHRGLEERTDYLVKLARDKQAAGAVLVIRKYCEPHAWDSVPLTKELRSAGISTLVLELEGADPGGQERTRLQAFLESL